MGFKIVVAVGLLAGTLLAAGVGITATYAKDCYSSFCNDEEWERYNEQYERDVDRYYDAMSQKQYENFHNNKYEDVYNPEPDVPPPRERW